MSPEVKAEVAKILEEQARKSCRIDVAFALRSIIMDMAAKHYTEQLT